MSYCRWSSDDFQCDVYVYEAEDGYVIHVASNQLVWTVPLPEHYTWDGQDEFDFDRWYARHRKLSDLFNDPTTHYRVPIGEPHGGKTYTRDTPALAAAKLLSLKRAGLQVPDYAIEALREEADDQ